MIAYFDFELSKISFFVWDHLLVLKAQHDAPLSTILFTFTDVKRKKKELVFGGAVDAAQVPGISSVLTIVPRTFMSKLDELVFGFTTARIKSTWKQQTKKYTSMKEHTSVHRSAELN